MTAPPRVPWWQTDLGDAEIAAVSRAIRARHVHHGPLCRELESALAARLELPHVATTTSGSAASPGSPSHAISGAAARASTSITPRRSSTRARA